jgi:uncharacterized oxidoreductase
LNIAPVALQLPIQKPSMMKMNGNTILITGGRSGIGLELARQLIAKGNKVLICGRSQNKLLKAKLELPDVGTFKCDISLEKDRSALLAWVKENYGRLNIIINNAAIVHKTNFLEDVDALQKLEAELATNLLAPIQLTKIFAPLIQGNSNPVVVNITTGLVYMPRAIYPFYNATKAALHSFSQVLRIQTNRLKVVEVMFPAVDTPWHEGNPPKIAIPAEEAVQEMLEKLGRGAEEIRVGAVKKLYFLSRLAPALALKKINEIK